MEPWHVEVTGTVPNTDPWVIQVFNQYDIDSIMYSSDLAGIALTITDPAPSDPAPSPSFVQ